MQPDVNFLFIKIVMLVCVCWDHKLLVLLWAVFWFLGMVNCYMHMEFPISVGIFFSGFFYCNSQIKVYLSTSHVFISNSVLSFHFIFQRSCCSIQAIKNSWKSVPFFVSQKKTLSADCLSPGQPLHQVGFWSLWELMCAQTQERLPSRDWCLTQQQRPGGTNRI